MSVCLRIAVGGEHYALAIEHVREVAALGEWVPVPGASPAVLGVRSLRGEMLPVLRLDDLLGVPASTPHQLVVVEDGERRAGLAVTVAAAVERLPSGGAGADGPYTTGAVLHDERLIGVVDVPAVLDAVAADHGTG